MKKIMLRAMCCSFRSRDLKSGLYCSNINTCLLFDLVGQFDPYSKHASNIISTEIILLTRYWTKNIYQLIFFTFIYKLCEMLFLMHLITLFYCQHERILQYFAQIMSRVFVFFVIGLMYFCSIFLLIIDHFMRRDMK